MYCILEKDAKTFEYMQKVYKYIRENKVDSLHELDNHIQKKEILAHLHLNGFAENDKQEALNWIKRYACTFRQYLNTIKVAALVYSLSHKNADLTWERFCELVDELRQKKSCLESIHA